MTSTRFGDFRLAKMQTMQGRESEAFNAELRLYGKTVAHVSNDGNGGSHIWHWIKDSKMIQDLFHTLACKVSEFDFEQDDQLVWDLLEATRMSRKKNLLVLLEEDGDFWENGQYRTTNATREEILAQAPEAKFWSKDTLEFV